MSDSYAKIKLAANHNQLILVKDQDLSAGNCNSVFMEFALRTDDWLMCEKIKAVFNNYYTRTLDKKLICGIPPEVLATPGEFEVGLYGINKNIRISTNKIEFHVGEGTCSGMITEPDGSINPDDSYIFNGGNVDGYGPDDTGRLVIYDGGGVHGY